MAYLANPARTIAVLEKHGIRAQKKYGQNFLIQPHILESIMDGADISGDDLVLEIGPGIGTMTQYLCERAGYVVAVEIDTSLLPVLDDTLADYDNVTVINGDILKTDIADIAATYGNGLKNFRIVANLPYYITTPILIKLLTDDIDFRSVTVMVQKEVADRMKASPGGKDYGALSLIVQYHTRPRIIIQAPPGAFMPAPKVGSSVIELERYTDKPVKAPDEDKMFRVIRASFNMRRKTLVNALSGGGICDKETVLSALEIMGLPADIRGERLSVEEFSRLSALV